jgi:AbrB family looped-hinge helix DNA binding protein
MPKVWTTGHVVIPKAWRDAYDLQPGVEVEIAKRDGAIVIRKASQHPTAREKPAR